MRFDVLAKACYFTSHAMPLHIPFDNSYARLPERFYAYCEPTNVRSPRLLALNTSLAELLGLDSGALAEPDGVAVLAGNQVPDGAASLALAYAGHQFGHFVPQLGDGRAILMGEVIGRDGKRRDLQWKGSGRTPYSRGGDGRAALGPVLREYVLSEAMQALGVPTTRALAALTTGEDVMREGRLPGAIVLRVAQSHLRVGTFQFFASRGDVEAVKLLADYAISRHYPEAADTAHPYRALLEGVIRRQATLVAAWVSLGFIHGVMNTDNTTISGETIDYGPCAFMDAFRSQAVFSAIDRNGRYAYGNQPHMAAWNLARLAETLLPLLGDSEGEAVAIAHAALENFGGVFETAHLEVMSSKLGLATAVEGDRELVHGLFGQLAEASADFTLAFRTLAEAATDTPDEAPFLALFGTARGVHEWLARWRSRLAMEALAPTERAAGMRAVNPLYIPRNHQVEAVIQAGLKGDFGPFATLNEVLARPFDEQPGRERFALAPTPEERVVQTFCGT